MAYVARRDLTASGPDGSVVRYKAGDVIPDFDSWDIHARRANLSLEWVEKTEDVILPTGMSADIPKIDDVRFAPTSELLCPKCDKGPFKTERALKTHIGIAHKS